MKGPTKRLHATYTWSHKDIYTHTTYVTNISLWDQVYTKAKHLATTIYIHTHTTYTYTIYIATNEKWRLHTILGPTRIYVD